MENIEYKITRFETLNISESQKLIVGFTITDLINSNFKYLETSFAMPEIANMTNQQICEMAYLKLSDEISGCLNYFLESQQNIIGSIFIPPNV